MKKLYAILLIVSMVATMLTSCTKSVEEAPTVVEPPVIEEVVVEEIPTVEAILYLPNENVDGFDEKTVTLETLDGETLLDALIDQGVYSDEIALLSMTQEGDNLTLDLSPAFGDAASTTGTAGELMLVGSLVNTFLTAFDCQTVTLLVEGHQLETGHTIYDFPLEFFAN